MTSPYNGHPSSGRLAGELRRRKGLRKSETLETPTHTARSAPLEKEIEKKVCDYAKSKNCYVRKFVSPNNRSVPDRIIIAPGGAVGFLELKRGGQKPTKAQELEMQTLEKVGAVVGWCDNVPDGKMFVDTLLSLGGFWK
jgi:hypothetical protein